MNDSPTTGQLFGFGEEELLHIHFCLHLGADQIRIGGELHDVEKVDRSGQLFNRVAANGLTFITQNTRKPSWNTQAVERYAAQGDTLMLTWISQGIGPFAGQVSSLTQKGSRVTQWEMLDYTANNSRRKGDVPTPKREEMINDFSIVDLMRMEQLVLVSSARNPRVQHLVSDPDAKPKVRKKGRTEGIHAEILCTHSDGILIHAPRKALPTCQRCAKAEELAKTKEGDTWRDTTQRSA